MTPAEIIAEARVLIQDTLTPRRYSDAELLQFVRRTLQRMAILRPDLFAVIEPLAVAAETALQSCPADSVRLIEVFQVQGGGTIVEVSRQTLDRTVPGWYTELAGQPVNFMRHVRNPNRFFLHPRPSAGVSVVVEYAQAPPAYTLGQTILHPAPVYFPVIVDGVVFLAESVDNEHVNSGRAKMFHDLFKQALGEGLQARAITDTQSGGADPRQVIA